MKTASLVLASTAALAAASLVPSTASARGLRVHLGGHVHVRAGAHVVVGSPPPPPVYYAPAPEPAYYYAPAPAPPAAYVAPAPRRPIFGLGLYASSATIDEEQEASGGGLFARVRFGERLELEGEIGGEAFVDTPRLDSRVGLAAIVNLGQPGGVTPYLVVGAGAVLVSPNGQDREEDPDTLPTYGYVEIGGGLSWQLGDHLALTGDIRFQARHLSEKDSSEARTIISTPGFKDEERAALGRISVIYYF
jgi:hypothetical protein